MNYRAIEFIDRFVPFVPNTNTISNSSIKNRSFIYCQSLVMIRTFIEFSINLCTRTTTANGCRFTFFLSVLTHSSTSFSVCHRLAVNICHVLAFTSIPFHRQWHRFHENREGKSRKEQPKPGLITAIKWVFCFFFLNAHLVFKGGGTISTRPHNRYLSNIEIEPWVIGHSHQIDLST